MNRDEFFAVLDQLTQSQIEASLSLWDQDHLKLVREYLERRDADTPASEPRAPALHSALAAAVGLATKAYKIATVALILAIGAMLAAILSGLMALQVLQHSG